MKAACIVEIVVTELAVSKRDMQGPYPNWNTINARCILSMLLIEEGYKKPRVADFIGCDRQTVYYDLRRFDALIRFDKEFKDQYLRCIAQIAQQEEVAA